MSDMMMLEEGDVDPREAEPIPPRGHRMEIEDILVPIEKVMRRRVASVAPEASVLDAVRLMAQGHFGSVVVLEGGRLAGILSERDVVTRVVLPGKDPARAVVRDHMTPDPETLRPEDPIAHAINIMAVEGFRHVPIVDREGHLRGIVSMRDVVNLVVEEFREEVLTLPPTPKRRGPERRHGG